MSAKSLPGVRIVLFLLAAIGAAPSTIAATPEWSLRDYVQTTWTHRDGLSLAPLIYITQTTDGYLWFVSQRLLIRFDGIRFVPVPVPCERVGALEEGENGSLWVVCREPRIQLFRRTANGLITEVVLSGLRWTVAPSLLRDTRGRLWIYGNALVRLEPDGSLREIHSDFREHIRDIVEDVAGTIWLAGTEKVVRMRDNRVESSPIGRVFGLAAAPDGGVFVCGPEDRVRHLEGTSDKVVARASPEVIFLASDRCMAADAAGGLWVGTRQHGIARIHRGRVETSLSRNEIGGTVNDVFVDREDNIWVASSAGLHRFRKPHARLLTLAVREVPPNPLAVFVDSREDVWIRGSAQYVRLNLASGTSHVFQGREIANAFGEDEAGRIWLATPQEIGYIDGRSFRPVRDVTGSPVSNVFAFTKDQNGHLWAVAEDIGIYQVTPGPPRRVFDEPAANVDLLVSSRHGVWVTLDGGGVKQYLPGRERIFHDTEQGKGKQVHTLLEDGDVIWMGDFGGLLRWRGGRWTRWTRAHGLPGAGGVQEITRDRSGRLWLMTSGGIVVLSREDLDATPDGSPRSLRFVQIGSLDRVVPHPSPPKSSPRVSMDRDGRLYFATIDSVAVVDPAAVAPLSLRPTIVLESVIADNEPVDPIGTRRLTAPSRLQFGYTSLSLRSPETIRFRYRLENYDEDWIEAGNARQVTYGTLRPGTYRFQVIGSGSEGVWNEEGTSFAFEIVPLFYNTWWFRALVVAVVAAAIGGVHRLRLRRLTRQLHIRFEERLAERTRIARELHDTLLQSFHGVMFRFRAAANVLPDQPLDAKQRLETALQHGTHAIREGRDAVQGLRDSTVMTNDLAVVLRTLGEELAISENDFAHGRTVTVEVAVQGTPQALRPIVRDDIYRIGSEALRNAFRHACARRIEVEIRYDSGQFQLRVRDDGQGIDAGAREAHRAGHFGLPGMRERAEQIGGHVEVWSKAGLGTEVALTIPGATVYASPPPRRPLWPFARR